MQNFNQQSPEARIAGGLLDVHSIFDTIQGEGPFTGHRAIFIRLAGCNLQCPGCDTDYTSNRKSMTISEVVSEVQFQLAHVCDLIVITGGEPFRQAATTHLILALVAGTVSKIQVETNGVFGIPQDLWRFLGSPLHVVVSPKTNKIHESCVVASAFKYVIDHQSVREEDGLPIRALGHKAKPYIARPPIGYKGHIYVNPADERDPVADRANLVAARDSAFRHGYILGVQLHKLVDVP